MHHIKAGILPVLAPAGRVVDAFRLDQRVMKP